MATATVDEPVVDEQIWRAWVQKGRRREEETVRKMRLVAGVVVILLALGGAFYRLSAS